MFGKQFLNRHAEISCTAYGNKAKFKRPDTEKLSTRKNITSTSDTKQIRLRYYLRYKQCIIEKQNWISEFQIMAGRHHNSTKMMYCNNYKYFRRPIVPFLVPKSENIDTSVSFNQDILKNVMRNAQKQCYSFQHKRTPYKSIETQTDYRDSESQTTPWEPSYIIKPGHNPEALTIAHLTWNHGTEISIHDVEVINRIRKKRELEATLPPMDTPANIKKRTAIINAIEIDEWAFRESEIQAIMDYRLELLNAISKSREQEKERKLQDRFDRLKIFLLERRDKEINSTKHNLRRELRKLYRKHQQKQQPLKHDIIKEYADLSSELYAPQMRNGEHPQRRHEVIQKELLGEKCVDYVHEISTLPNWLPTLEELNAIKPKPKPAELCIRETRWTKEKLNQLHSDLKAIRFSTKAIEVSMLLKTKYKLPPLPSIPEVMNIENVVNTNIDQSSTFIQKIIRGRAIQCLMFEGRNRCRELIEELQSAYGLEGQSKKEHQREKKRILELQELQSETTMQEDRLCEILNSLEGMTVSGMLDYLSKELIRLEDERRIHAFALLAERERAMREAAEAGRRQLEYNRRREFDEMFRQIIKVNQESVEIYLEDIINEGIEWVSDEAAKAYILELCDKVDSVSRDAQNNASKLAEEEMVANMIYNFVLPEVEKCNLRKNIRNKQQAYLHNAHAAIYKEILNLPSTGDTNLLDEKYKRSNLSKKPNTKKISDTSSTICVTEAELKSESVYVSSLKDIEIIVESIISNVISII